MTDHLPRLAVFLCALMTSFAVASALRARSVVELVIGPSEPLHSSLPMPNDILAMTVGLATPMSGTCVSVARNAGGTVEETWW